jgi:hypothetical protein
MYTVVNSNITRCFQVPVVVSASRTRYTSYLRVGHYNHYRHLQTTTRRSISQSRHMLPCHQRPSRFSPKSVEISCVSRTCWLQRNCRRPIYGVCNGSWLVYNVRSPMLRLINNMFQIRPIFVKTNDQVGILRAIQR